MVVSIVGQYPPNNRVFSFNQPPPPQPSPSGGEGATFSEFLYLLIRLTNGTGSPLRLIPDIPDAILTSASLKVPSMYVIGTAGHVDHGKSTLVKALTGIDPDRLPQEKEREMTIDLGFAWMSLPGGREVSIVDVPGHERFIKNMLAGVGGIDLAMLVVAANESVMQQTREHLAILDILKIKRGLVVITKGDMVDPELVELVKAEVEDIVAGTILEGAPTQVVSAYTGEGMDALIATIESMLDETEARKDLGRPRLPVDRCFSVAGFGTVVTGTLIDGTLSVGQEVRLALSGERGRVRGLQSHQKKTERAEPGIRLAVNLSGLSRHDVQRGEMLTAGSWLQLTNRIDARIKMLKDASQSLSHNENVTFHLYTTEAPARVRLLDADVLGAGQEGWAQLHLQEPVPAVKGDLFVIRSADTTLGGGTIINPQPRRRHRRNIPSVLEQLAAMEAGSGLDAVAGAVEQWAPCDLKSLSQKANLPLEEVLSEVAGLAEEGQVVVLGSGPASPDSTVYSRESWSTLARRASDILRQYHGQYPLRRGMPREEMRSRLTIAQGAFPLVVEQLAGEGVLAEDGASLRTPQHSPALTSAQQKLADGYIRSLEGNPFSPPTDLPLDGEVLGLLIDEGRVVRVSDSVVFSAEAYKTMVERIIAHTRANGKITVGDGRDMFNSSRKYILPLLEHLDQEHITRRVGDERVLQ